MRVLFLLLIGACLITSAGCLSSFGPDQGTETTEPIGPGLVIEDSYPHSFTVTVIDQATNETILVRTADSKEASVIDLTSEISSSTDTAVATITTVNGTKWRKRISSYQKYRVTIARDGSIEAGVLEQ